MRPNLYRGLAVFAAVLLLATAVWSCGKAHAHSFYDAYCCNTTDCHAQRSGEFVKFTDAGWQVDVPKFGIHELVAFDDKRIRNTPLDEAAGFHLCIFAKALRCFYRPGAAG